MGSSFAAAATTYTWFLVVVAIFSFCPQRQFSVPSTSAQGQHDVYIGMEFDGLKPVLSGRKLNLLQRVDTLGSPLLPGWASDQIRRWFPQAQILSQQSEPAWAPKTDESAANSSPPTPYILDGQLFVAGPHGSQTLVLVPEGNNPKNASVCSNTPPLGATCKEVKEMESCDLPVLVLNGICDEICGRCTQREQQMPEQDEICAQSTKSGECGQAIETATKGDQETRGQVSKEQPQDSQEDNEGRKQAVGRSSGGPKESKNCQTLAELLRSRTDLSIMSILLERSVHPLLKAVADESFVGTAFIPNNSAFDKFASEVGISAEEILAGNSEFRDQIMDAHIVPGLPRRNLMPGQEFPTLSARWDIFVEKCENTVCIKSQSGFMASIIEQDITACSSVAHIIDNVLLPMSKDRALSQIPPESASPSAG